MDSRVGAGVFELKCRVFKSSKSLLIFQSPLRFRMELIENLGRILIRAYIPFSSAVQKSYL